MKKKVLYISEEFYPVSNGTVSCTENIINSLSEFYEVVLYTGAKTKMNSIDENFPNINIKSPEYKLNDYLNEWRSNTVLNICKDKKWFKIGKLVFRILTYPIYIINKIYGYSTYHGWSKNIPKLIMKIEDLSGYYAIIAVAAPFSNIVAAVDIKKAFKKLNLILMPFDLYSDNITRLNQEGLDNTLRNKRVREEMSWYEYADVVIVTEEMYDTIANSELYDFKRKIIPLKMPMLAVDHEYDCSDNDLINRDEIIIVYTGRFYKDIRNPDFSLKLVEKLVEIDPRVVLHIYGFGCEDIIDQFKKRIGDNLIFHGNRGKQEVLNAINNADILLNISNKTTTQAPSKIIEYVSSRKPIINIYSVDNDRCVRILDKYQLSISIKEDISMLEDYVDQLRSFITCNIGKKMSKNEIVREYSEYSAEYFVNKMMEKLKDK